MTYPMSQPFKTFDRRLVPIRYGQIICGPPGSGKTTYCNGMQQYLRAIGRDCLVVNFDPANEITIPLVTDKESSTKTASPSATSSLPYDILLDVCQDVINLNCVMEELALGPNGGLLYCLEYMEQHMDVILDLICTRLEEYEEQKQQPNNCSIGLRDTTYVLFDFPGQVELFTHSRSVQHICQSLMNEGNFKLAAIQLIGKSLTIHIFFILYFCSSIFYNQRNLWYHHALPSSSPIILPF